MPPVLALVMPGEVCSDPARQAPGVGRAAGGEALGAGRKAADLCALGPRGHSGTGGGWGEGPQVGCEREGFLHRERQRGLLLWGKGQVQMWG